MSVLAGRLKGLFAKPSRVQLGAGEDQGERDSEEAASVKEKKITQQATENAEDTVTQSFESTPTIERKDTSSSSEG